MLSINEYLRWFFQAPFDESQGEGARVRYISNAVGRDPPEFDHAATVALSRTFTCHPDYTYWFACRLTRFRRETRSDRVRAAALWGMVSENGVRDDPCNNLMECFARIILVSYGRTDGCQSPETVSFFPELPQPVIPPCTKRQRACFQQAMDYIPIARLREFMWYIPNLPHHMRCSYNRCLQLDEIQRDVEDYIMDGPNLARARFVRWAGRHKCLGPDIGRHIASFLVAKRLLRAFPSIAYTGTGATPAPNTTIQTSPP